MNLDPPYPEADHRPGVVTISASPLAPDTSTPFLALAPLRFPSALRLMPEQFALLCAENRKAVLELAADGQVLAMTPTGTETGGRNSELAFQLQRFARSGTTWKLKLIRRSHPRRLAKQSAPGRTQHRLWPGQASHRTPLRNRLQVA